MIASANDFPAAILLIVTEASSLILGIFSGIVIMKLSTVVVLLPREILTGCVKVTFMISSHSTSLTLNSPTEISYSFVQGE